MAPTPKRKVKKAIPIKKKPIVKYSSNVAKQQADLNKKGAGLKVDGLLGPKTQAAIDKLSKPTSNATFKSSSPLRTATISAPRKSSKFGNPLTGGFFKNVVGGAKIVGSGFKDAITVAAKKAGSSISANAIDATGKSSYADELSYRDTSGGKVYTTAGLEAYGIAPNDPRIDKGQGFVPPDFMPVLDSGDIKKSEMTGSLNDAVLSSGQFMDQAPTPENPTGSTITETNRTISSGTSPSSALDTPVEDPVEPPPDETITPPSTTQTPGTGNFNTGLGIKFDELNMGLNGSSVADKTAWMSKGSKGEFQTAQTINYANNAAKMFATPEQANMYFSTPEGQAKAQTYISMGGKIQDIVNKVKPVTNGITPAQTTAEYLAGGPASLAGERKAMNDMIAMENNFTQKQRDILFGTEGQFGIIEQQKMEADARKDYYDRMLEMQEKSLKDKAKLEIDKAEAEWEAKDAEVEMNRIQAKSNLTEFLAKIGALRTDGNSLLGIEKLEQAYQAQRQALRQNFQFAKRQIQGEMNDKIFGLEMDVEDKKFKLSQDLSKTEREIALEGMKLDYNFQKTMNEMKLKWADSIKTERERLERKAEAAADASNTQWLSLVGAGIDPSLIPSMLNSKGKVIMNTTNAGIIQNAKNKLPETTPDYKGEALTLDLKKAKAIVDKTGMSSSDIQQLQNDLNAGWSLEQIAKNTGMPTTVFNILKPYIVAK